ncbi:MAG: endonuclease VIII [Clostridia bacterium]|nr:endonuclease VIII [Clostridia bacterium]
MIELPEALTIACQLNDSIKGKKIANVTAAQTPHKFAWYHGDPQSYHELLYGKTIKGVRGFGSMVEIEAEDKRVLFSEGVGVRYHNQNEQRPQKHQLLIEFEDFSAVSACVQMYGALCSFGEGEYDNIYYKTAKEKPSPLSEEFSKVYFDRLATIPEVQKLSAKAFLATEQRIPGLGNGVLQDILYIAGIHPKRKMNTLSIADKEKLFDTIKSTLAEMTFQGGRDTERDLFGCPGGYRTKASKNTAGRQCDICGNTIKKENYMGGSIYYCNGCQTI